MSAYRTPGRQVLLVPYYRQNECCPWCGANTAFLYSHASNCEWHVALKQSGINKMALPGEPCVELPPKRYDFLGYPLHVSVPSLWDRIKSKLLGKQ